MALSIVFPLIAFHRFFSSFPLQYDKQDIESVFWYKDYNSVVFMTLDWLLVFDRSLFVAKGDDIPGRKFIALTQYGTLTNYTRLKNCMWQGCDEKVTPKTRKVMNTAGRKRQGAL